MGNDQLGQDGRSARVVLTGGPEGLLVDLVGGDSAVTADLFVRGALIGPMLTRMAVNAWEWGPSLYSGSAAYYPRDRLAYPKAFAEALATELHVKINNMPGPYLPEIGSPVEMSAPRFGFSKDSGTLATDAPSLAGLSYDLVAEVGRRDGLESAVPAVTRDADRYTNLPPRLPAEVAAKGAQLAGEVAEPYAKLLAIQTYLRKFPYNLDSRPGHSYDALRRLFGSNPADQVGYAEQFAAAFAVLARSRGFPARVAVGYLLNESRKRDGAYQVTTGDAHAWAEVNLAGFGWVAFEPTDPQRRAGVAQKPPETPTEQNNPNAKPNQESKASQPTEDPNLPKIATDTRSVLDWALYVLIGLGVLVVLTPVAVAAEKFRRRRARRWAAGPRASSAPGSKPWIACWRTVFR